MAASYVFPGAAAAPSGLERRFAAANAAVFEAHLHQAEEFSGIPLWGALDDPSGLSDLGSQYFTYAFSCAAFESIEARIGPPSMAAGYSMGIYAACRALRAFSFGTGLEIIRTAYSIMSSRLEGPEAGMGAITGLSEAEVRALLPPSGEVELVNVNNPASMVVSGPVRSLERVFSAAAGEGAISARAIAASIPYHHTRILAGSSSDLARALASMELAPPRAPLFSCVDQKPASSRSGIASALAANLDRNIRWGDTFLAMARSGGNLFIDPGPGLSLARIARFIESGARIADLRALAGAAQPMENGR